MVLFYWQIILFISRHLFLERSKIISQYDKTLRYMSRSRLIGHHYWYSGLVVTVASRQEGSGWPKAPFCAFCPVMYWQHVQGELHMSNARESWNKCTHCHLLWKMNKKNFKKRSVIMSAVVFWTFGPNYEQNIATKTTLVVISIKN